MYYNNKDIFKKIKLQNIKDDDIDDVKFLKIISSLFYYRDYELYDFEINIDKMLDIVMNEIEKGYYLFLFVFKRYVLKYHNKPNMYYNCILSMFGKLL